MFSMKTFVIEVLMVFFYAIFYNAGKWYMKVIVNLNSNHLCIAMMQTVQQVADGPRVGSHK